MRVLLTGATGFIGSALLARLVADGHEVIAVTRRVRPALCRPDARWIALDMAQAVSAEAWAPHLDGVDAAVNCAGVLQDGLGDSTAGVHVIGAAALFTALERAGVRRIVQISALGIDRPDLDKTHTAFSASKRAGDADLASRDLDWVILRPSVVLGSAAYGGSALLRGLAALPVQPRMAEAAPLQVVQLTDLVDSVVHFLQPEAPARLTLEVCGPEPLLLADILAAYRRWLGLGTPRTVPVPRWLLASVARLGDLAGRLGWRPPVRTTTLIELARGSTGDPKPWSDLTGIAPKSLAQALAETPASVQERWFARLYFLKPLAIAVLAMFWLLTGLIALGPGWEAGQALLTAAGLSPRAASTLAVAGAIADILIGLGIAVHATAKRALGASIALSTIYLAAATILMPALWLDPLGAVVKIAPIMLLSLVALAIADNR